MTRTDEALLFPMKESQQFFVISFQGIILHADGLFD